MNATPVQPTLLGAARDFIRKSAGTAALAIVPLAAVALAPEAKAQTVFGSPNLNFINSGSANYGTSFPSGSQFSFAGGVTNNITSLRLGADGTISDFGSGGSNMDLTLRLSTAVTTADIPGSTVIPVSYDFTLNKQTGIAGDVSWYLRASFTGESIIDIASGTLSTGSATFTGSGNYTTSGNVVADNTKDFNLYLEVSYSTAPGDVLAINMNSASQGFTVNAIPEPATNAAILGFGALGFVVLRRRTRAAA